MSAGAFSLLIIAFALVMLCVLAPILLWLLVKHHWKPSIVVAGVIAAGFCIAAWATGYGVRYGHWNDAIHEHCVRDSPAGTRCP